LNKKHLKDALIPSICFFVIAVPTSLIVLFFSLNLNESDQREVYYYLTAYIVVLGCICALLGYSISKKSRKLLTISLFLLGGCLLFFLIGLFPVG
jgi:hypothetical protein